MICVVRFCTLRESKSLRPCENRTRFSQCDTEAKRLRGRQSEKQGQERTGNSRGKSVLARGTPQELASEQESVIKGGGREGGRL